MNKTCLILGSNSDIGKAIAYEFAKKGYNLILASRSISEYQKRLSSDLSIRHSVIVSNTKFNGINYKEHHSFIKGLLPFPNVIISVFGNLGNQELATKKFEESYNIISTNFIGHVSLLNTCCKEMIDNKVKGTIVGVSSVAGERGRQSNYIYGAAKSGFSTYLSGLRNAMYNKDIHVLTVKPGFVKTKMIEDLKTPKKLTTTPEKVASSIYKAYKKKKNVIYVLPIWKLIMLIIKNIPESIFKKLKL